MPNNLPEPNTRKEKFLASAAGMAVEKPEPLTREEMFLNAIPSGGGGGGGTTDYNDLTNKPSINGVTLTGAKTAADLGIVSNMQANWNETNPESGGYIWNKPGNPGNGTVTIARNGTQISAFTLNQSSDTYVNIAVPDVDTVLSPTSTNPVQNKAVQAPVSRLIDSGTKNLLEITAASQTINGVKFTVNDDGTITANGTATARVSFQLVRKNMQPGDYVLSNDKITSTDTYWLEQYVYYSSTSHPYYQTYTNGTYTPFSITQVPEFTITYLIINSGQTVSNLVFKPMICTAEDYAISPDFVPYAKSNHELTQDVEPIPRLVNSGAKNLVKPPRSSDTIPGVTTTINADGSITLNGTCTASTFATYIFGAPLLPAGSYRLSGCPSGGSGSTFELSCGGGGLSKVTDYGNSTAFTLSAETQLTYIQIVARAGAVFNNTTFFPMICTAENYAVSPAFVPYAPTNRELYDMIIALQNGG